MQILVILFSGWRTISLLLLLSVRLFVKNSRILQFAFAGLLLALSLQAAGYAIDHSALHGGIDTRVLYNWLSLLLAPISLLPRLTNPDAPLFNSWPTTLLVVFGNSIYCAALCKLLQLLFLRLSRNLPDGNRVLVKQKSHSAARHTRDSAFNLPNF
jgi:hypothetical protein